MYTRRHHDAATGDCRIHADRPRMCRDYPYGRACDQPECTAENRGAPVDLVPLRIERAPAVSTELDAERCALARRPDHRPGARRSGHKPAPPVPRWARDRQRGTAGRPGR